MKIRIIFRCLRCGSFSIRPSSHRKLKDSILRLIGLRPHRCHLCRRRFYLFKPLSLRPFLIALNSHADGSPSFLDQVKGAIYVRRTKATPF